jgi:putative tryptophan/tyrosine transport system substrate-binding protein
MFDIRRREFITLLAGAAVVAPFPTRAQPSGKVYVIGYLGVTSYDAEYRRRDDALRTGLRQLGYEEGRNIVLHYRWAEGKYDRLLELAAELVKLNVDVIVTHSTPGARAAKQATSTIPIVMAAVGDPIEAGLVPSLARPGGNLTGLTFFFAEVCAKRVELIKEAIPTLTRLAVLLNPGNPSAAIAVSHMQRMAGVLGIELIRMEVKSRDDLAAAILMATMRGSPAFVAVEDPLIISEGRQIGGLALQNRIAMVGFRPHAEAGALMEYGVDLNDLWYRSAAFVDKILKGAPPAELPIERAVKFDLVVNLKTAKALGIELPTSILLRAKEVIE